MPLYDYQCEKCGEAAERYLPLDRFEEPQACATCQTFMTKVLTVGRIAGDFQPYECPVTGKLIEGRAAHRENLARTGCRILEPGERGDQARRQKALDDQIDKIAEDSAVELINNLPEEKRQILAGELEHGGDAIMERRTAV